MFFLKRNLPPAERTLRLVLAAGAAYLTYAFSSAGWMLIGGYATAAMLAASAIVGVCPACALFGRKPI